MTTPQCFKMATPAPSPRSLLKTTVLLRISEEKAAMEEESAGNRNLDLLCTLIKDNFKLTCTTEKAVNEGVVEVFLVVTRENIPYFLHIEAEVVDQELVKTLNVRENI